MKRKNIILFALIILLSAGQLWAQRERSPYRPLSTFNGDTLRYLEFNYTIRHAQYANKTVGEILKELECPVVYIDEYMRGNGTLYSINLGIKQTEDSPNEMKDYYITIAFETPLQLSEFRVVYEGQNRILTSQLYNFIKDLRVEAVRSNEYIIRDPELLENRRRVYEENDRKGREAQQELDRRRRENNK